MALPHSPKTQQPERWPRFIDELCRRLIAAGAHRIYLFGSCARGEADEDSDVDVVVIKDTALPFFERRPLGLRNRRVRACSSARRRVACAGAGGQV